MSKSSLAAGYTQVPHELLDRLMRARLAPNQWQVVLCLLRKTYGFHRTADRISNSQIQEATGLGKSVVIRALRNLRRMGIVVREGRSIGLREVAALSPEVAAQLPEGSSPATEKVAVLLPTKDNKEISTKETRQKKEGVREKASAPSFEKYTESLRARFPDISFDLELEKFNLYWAEGGRRLNRPSMALLNWMTKARQIRQEKENAARSGIHAQHHPPALSQAGYGPGKHDLSTWLDR